MGSKDNPAQVAPEVAAMQAAARLPRALMGGTATMRACGRQWLPQHPAEADTHYQARLKRAVLRNFFGRTVDVLVGKLFGRDLVADASVPAELVALFDDVDMCGRGLTQLAREVMRAAMVDGMAAVLVEYPVLEDAQSLAEEREMGGRPYLVPLSVDRILGIRFGQRAGVPVIEQLRLKSRVVEADGAFGAATVDEITVIEPERVQRYRSDARGRWALVGERVNLLGLVPVVPIYAGQVGLFEARPPLMDLAWMNLEHWQIRSDQRNALNVASFPILAASGWTEEGDGKLAFGPNRLLSTANPQGKFYYVESNGAHLEAGRRELEALEEQMRLFGLQFEVSKSGGTTATARAIDAAEAAAPLKAWARGLEDAFEHILALMERWRRVAGGLPVGPAGAIERVGRVRFENITVEDGANV